MTLLAALIAGLGLKADATEQQVITHVAALQAQVKAPSVPKEIATALQLTEGADMTVALSAVQSLIGGKSTADATIAALQGQIAALQNTRAGDEVTSLVDKALVDGKLLPAMKDWALDLGKTNVAALKAYIDKAVPVVPGAAQTQGKGDPTEKTAVLSAEAKGVFAAFGISAEDAIKFQAGKA